YAGPALPVRTINIFVFLEEFSLFTRQNTLSEKNGNAKRFSEEKPCGLAERECFQAIISRKREQEKTGVPKT
ncbi:MAG: hypothetical protein ACI33N_03505, partial [Desulfovibrionaceae bacterium]